MAAELVDMTIELGSGRKISLSEEEARDIYRKLNDLFYRPTFIPTYPSPWRTPYTWPTYYTTSNTYTVKGA